MTAATLDALDALESESIHIFREVAGEFDRPVILFSGGKDSTLLVHLAGVALSENCGRFVWQVLDWNEPAIGFYESLGARVMKEWLTMRVDGEALRRLAGD